MIIFLNLAHTVYMNRAELNLAVNTRGNINTHTLFSSASVNPAHERSIDPVSAACHDALSTKVTAAAGV